MSLRTRLRSALFFAGLASIAAAVANAATLGVGPGQPFAAPCAAIAVAAANDTILIDATGDYAGDVCAWTTNGLTLRGINGRPHIDAAGQNAQGKAIWVIAGDDTTVDNIEFSGCRVPDRNGAGIRQEGRNLDVRHSSFHDNENGILAGDRAGSTITIEYSEFAHNGAGDGQSHNLYVNHVDRLLFRYNWSHGAIVGHLLKTRALENHVLYNRLTGEKGGTESYEINLPSGGLSFVIGNLIEQPASSENGAMLDYLSEPNTANPDDRLFVVNNTFVNDRSSGTFLQIGTTTNTPVVARNNLFIGPGTPCTQEDGALDHNIAGDAGMLVDASAYDYRLRPDAPAIDAGTQAGSGAGQPLTALTEYVHPVSMSPRPIDAIPDAGAYEWQGDPIYRDGFER